MKFTDKQGNVRDIDWEREHKAAKEDSDLAAYAWRGGTGGEWAGRNPTSVAGTDASWCERYDVPKSYKVLDVLRDVPRDGRWVELGCSSGAHTRIMNGAGFGNVLGMDINFASLIEAPAGKVCQADARYLPFADRSTNITTSGTLMHLGPEQRLRDCIAELVRVTDRYLFMIELWHATPMMFVFGDLLPPAWAYPWEAIIMGLLGPGWVWRHREVMGLSGRHVGKTATLAVMLLERQ